MSKQLKHLTSRERESTQSGNVSSGTSTLQQRKRSMKKDKELRKGSGTKLSIPTIEPDMQQAKTLFKPDSTVKQLPPEYYVSISVDGSRHMDQPNHLSNDQVNNICLERKLRPISGLRHYVKPNTNVVDDTDFIERVSRLSTIKWLDLSSNNLKSYPKQLCNLTLLERLNLTDNKLSEKTIPIEIENYESLLEMVLDSNCLTDLPKALPHFKKMVHLSAQNNSIGNLKFLEGLRKLRYLNMNGNNISTIDEALYDLDKLEMLYLSHNRLNLLQPKFLRSNLNNLKQLDVSFNCVTFIPAEIFLLPHLDSLNLSNNRITKLPSLPVTFNRSLPINSVDLSSNGLQKFYEYLLTVAVHTDLSANRIRCLPSIAIRNLTVAQSNRKSLKLDGNPLEYPPLDICTSGLRILKLFFEEAALTTPLKHGFKISMIGDDGSGKTSLAYAIEDYNAQTNLMEQLIGLVEAPKNANSALEVPQEIEEKFIEVHEFSFKCNKEEKYWKNESLPSNDTKTNDKDLKMQQSMPVSIFDINGSPSQFGHLNYTFIDKTSLVILCVDVTTFDKQLNSDIETAEKNLKYWLDLIFFKMSRTCSMYVLPVCTKCDSFLKMHKKLQDTWDLQQKELEQSKIDPIQLLLKSEEQRHQTDPDKLAKKKAEIANQLKSVSKSILTTINNHFKARLNYVKTELDKIEGQTKISASESDRLKRFANVYNYSKPSVHTECITTSSANLEGIEYLNNTIRDIACNNDKYFPNVNKRIPSLWNEVENYMFSWLNHIKRKSNTNYDTMSIATYSLPSLSVLCMDYDEYKARILEKYGMDDMLAQITNFFTSEGT
jgi:Leucine-rich repeat (LRR) protein